MRLTGISGCARIAAALPSRFTKASSPFAIPGIRGGQGEPLMREEDVPWMDELPLVSLRNARVFFSRLSTPGGELQTRAGIENKALAQ